MDVGRKEEGGSKQRGSMEKKPQGIKPGEGFRPSSGLLRLQQKVEGGRSCSENGTCRVLDASYRDMCLRTEGSLREIKNPRSVVSGEA